MWYIEICHYQRPSSTFKVISAILSENKCSLFSGLYNYMRMKDDIAAMILSDLLRPFQA